MSHPARGMHVIGHIAFHVPGRHDAVWYI